MNRIVNLILIASILSLVSCSGDGSSSSLTASSRDEIFSDSAVTSFQQTAGVVFTKPSLMDQILGSAYAVSGNIKCIEGSSVSFELDALGSTVHVDTKCNSIMDLNIRRGLLESLAGKRILMSYAGGSDARSQGRAITLNAVGSFWTTYDNIPAGSANTGHNEHLCKDKISFNETNGQVTIEHDTFNSLASGADTTQDCLNSEFVGATLADYKKVLNYRFKDGTLEMDPDGLDFTVNNDYVRFCIDNDSNATCDI